MGLFKRVLKAQQGSLKRLLEIKQRDFKRVLTNQKGIPKGP
jgi:hypothetical protein